MLRIVMHLLSMAIDAPTCENNGKFEFEQTKVGLISERFETRIPDIPGQSELNITPRHERLLSHPSHLHDRTQAPLLCIKIGTAPRPT